MLCCSRDSDLSTIISNLHQSRQLVMPETQSRCEFKRNPLDVGLAAAGEGWGTSCCPGLLLPLLSLSLLCPIPSFSSCFFSVSLFNDKKSLNILVKDECGKDFTVVVELFGGPSLVLFSNPVVCVKGACASTGGKCPQGWCQVKQKGLAESMI